MSDLRTVFGHYFTHAHNLQTWLSNQKLPRTITVDPENCQICPVKKDWPGRLADLSAGNIILYGTNGHFCSLNLDEK